MPAKIVIRARWYPDGTSGNLSWIRQVVAHEFTHLVTFAAIDESLFPLRRLMANLTLPMWFVEGLAQYEAEEWHSLKEMVLRDEAQREEIMSEGSLGAFYFFEGWGRTSGYYQSDSFVHYIFDHYGRDKIAKILAHLRRQPLFHFSAGLALTSGDLAFYPTSYFLSFNQTLEEILAKDSSLLYSEWREWIREEYKGKEDFCEDTLEEGELLTYQGRRNQHPVFSPSGSMLAFASNRGYDYAIFDLYLMDIQSKEVKRLRRGINPFISFSPDGKKLVLSAYKEGRFSLYLFSLEALPGRLLTVPEKELIFAPLEKDSLMRSIGEKEVTYPSFPYRPRIPVRYSLS